MSNIYWISGNSVSNMTNVTTAGDKGQVLIPNGTSTITTALSSLSNANGPYTPKQNNSTAYRMSSVVKTRLTVPSQKGSLSFTWYDYSSNTIAKQTPSWNNYNSSILTIGGTYQEQSNTGTYTATFAIKDTTLYEWSDGTTGTKSVNWTIGPYTEQPWYFEPVYAQLGSKTKYKFPIGYDGSSIVERSYVDNLKFYQVTGSVGLTLYFQPSSSNEIKEWQQISPTHSNCGVYNASGSKIASLSWSDKNQGIIKSSVIKGSSIGNSTSPVRLYFSLGGGNIQSTGMLDTEIDVAYGSKAAYVWDLNGITYIMGI